VDQHPYPQQDFNTTATHSLGSLLRAQRYHFETRCVFRGSTISEYNFDIDGNISPDHIVDCVRVAYRRLGLSVYGVVKFDIFFGLILSHETGQGTTYSAFYPSSNTRIADSKFVYSDAQSLRRFHAFLSSISIPEILARNFKGDSKDCIYMVKSLLVRFYHRRQPR
jgi:hypothetical protein